MELIVNGRPHNVDVSPDDHKQRVLRDALGMTGTKYGSGLGICGSCTVHLDGQVTRSCITTVAAAEGREITTIEGLSASGGLHPVQRAFLELEVPQCSWCMSGQMMTAAAFLEKNSAPNETEIVEAMTGNYCRCGCYVRIKTAVAMAAEIAREDS